MKCLERLVLPRGCTLFGASGLPALRSVAYGVCSDGLLSWNPRQVRFESLVAPAIGGPASAIGGPLTGRTTTFADVACVLGRESFPFPP
jgi:hypothetical protein